MPTGNQCVSGVKNIKNPTNLTSWPRRLILNGVINGISFKTVRSRQFYELGCLQKNAFLKQNKFTPACLVSL